MKCCCFERNSYSRLEINGGLHTSRGTFCPPFRQLENLQLRDTIKQNRKFFLLLNSTLSTVRL